MDSTCYPAGAASSFSESHTQVALNGLMRLPKFHESHADRDRQAYGLSHAIVSRALADSPLISEATKEKVRLVASELGYRKNAVMANLMAHDAGRAGSGGPLDHRRYFPVSSRPVLQF
jgi:hypothetical protein